MKILLTIMALTVVFSLHAAKHERRSPAVAEWRRISTADIPRELELIVGSGACFRGVRAELGDAALFDRMARLLKKHFCKYDQKTVSAALRQMRPLIPAVDPVRAATDLTHIRSRVEIVADKDPETWRPVLETIDAMRSELIVNGR